MFLIIIIIILIVVFFLFNKKKNKKHDKRFDNIRSINTDINNDTSHRNTFIDTIINKIDLTHDTKFIRPSVMTLKCMRAGIRDSHKQKMWVALRYACAVGVAIAAPILCNFFLGKQTLPMLGLCTIGGLVLGFFYPVIRLDSMIQNRKIQIDMAFPDFVDLTLVCVEAGMTAEQTFAKIVDDLKRFSPVMADEVALLSAEITYFLDPRTAYNNFYYRTNNEFVKAFCGVLLQSIQYGTPLAQGLRALSAEVREAQMAVIERKAAALPSKLTVPMMGFTLPVLFVVILYSAIVQVIEQWPSS
jgi:tight adherence protein C